MSSEYFGFIDFTFENKTENWVEIKDIQLNFQDKKIGKFVKIISGKELNIYLESIKIRNNIKEYNKRVILGTVAVIGNSIAKSSNGRNGQLIGNTLLAGSLTSLTLDEMNKQIDKLENAEIFPHNHLMSKDFLIPPGLFVKKFLIINSENSKTGYIKDILLTYSTVINGVSKTKTIKLRIRKYRISIYQKHIKRS